MLFTWKTYKDSRLTLKYRIVLQARLHFMARKGNHITYHSASSKQGCIGGSTVLEHSKV